MKKNIDAHTKKEFPHNPVVASLKMLALRKKKLRISAATECVRDISLRNKTKGEKNKQKWNFGAIWWKL